MLLRPKGKKYYDEIHFHWPIRRKNTVFNFVVEFRKNSFIWQTKDEFLGKIKMALHIF